MRITCSYAAAVVSAAIVLTACNKQTNNLFRRPSTTLSPSASSAPGNSAAGIPPQTNPAAPYVLSAESAGPYINFSIYNLGTTDLVIEKEDLAIISPDNRNIVPYTKTTAIIDLPQPAIVKPNSSINGRAIFKKINSPLGKRLVFKPDEVGTFADINRPSIQTR